MATTTERLKDLLGTALEMEKRGFTYYDAAVNTCQNELGRELFRSLRDDETVHIERIKRIYESVLGGTRWSSEWESLDVGPHPELNTLYKEMARKHGPRIRANTSDLQALDVGIDLELRAVKYYEGALPGAHEIVERKFLERMVNEERAHHRALVNTRQFLTNPEAWFVEQEKPGLDGA
jgi:rubrerythrin